MPVKVTESSANIYTKISKIYFQPYAHTTLIFDDYHCNLLFPSPMLVQSNLYMTARIYIQSSHAIYYSHCMSKTTSQNFQLPYIFCKNDLYTRFQPEGCPAVLWKPIFGRDTRKIPLISYNFMGKHAFWTASIQCLAKSLPVYNGHLAISLG